MNYRHIYHAGHFADVFKHCLLTIVLKHLCQKEKPFVYIDTHAGTGKYDLSTEEVIRSPEYQQGIEILLKQKTIIPEMQSYVEIIKPYIQDNILQYYPGSPLIAEHFIREQDEMILNELHDEDFASLKLNLKKIKNCHFHHRDAYEFLPAILPPDIKRGVILIDPPYEKKSEYSDIVETLEKSIKRFPNGIYMIWYPIVSNEYQILLKKIKSNIHADMIETHFTIKPIPNEKEGLIGTGMIIINPPYQMDATAKRVTRYLEELYTPST